TTENHLSFSNDMDITIAKPKVNMIVVDRSKIENIKTCLDNMKFPKIPVDIPSILYGASTTCFISFIILIIQNDLKASFLNLFCAFICLIIGIALNMFPNLSNNVTQNQKDHQYAKDHVKKVLESCSQESCPPQ
ncbi:MAG: hypothetical protein Q4Q00_07970, partial [Turicibacter sp.]|nr:hypothetical protein [Turicibacter sp.]